VGAFDIVVPAAVDRELRAPDVVYPSRVYPETALYAQLRPQLLEPPDLEPEPLSLFGAGEAAAISLARRTLGAVLLINDARPAAHARNLGLAVVSVPSMIVIARVQELVPDHVARALLSAAERHGTSPAVVAAAASILDRVV
jgi:predicted nucleic acid-binding protein